VEGSGTKGGYPDACQVPDKPLSISLDKQMVLGTVNQCGTLSRLG